MIRLILFLVIFLQIVCGQIFTETKRIGAEEQSAINFNHPQAVDVSADGMVYVVDTGNNHIQIFSSQGRFLKSVGGFGFKDDQFDRPMDIWARTLINIYVSDYNNQRIQRYNRTMHLISSLTSQESFDPRFQFAEVASCAVNSQNDLFVLDRGENKIIKFNRNSQPERSFGGFESGEGQLEEPRQLDILKDKFLLVSDRGRKAIVFFDFFGNFIRTLNAPQFKTPTGLAVDNSGRIFIADTGAKKIFIVDKQLTNVSSLTLKLRQPLKQPLDLAILPQPDKKIKTCRLYLIDANQLIIGKLTNSCE